MIGWLISQLKQNLNCAQFFNEKMSDYYDIDAILGEQEVYWLKLSNIFKSLPVTFSCDAYNLGFLKPHQEIEEIDSSDDESDLQNDIRQGTRVDIPLWLAKVLFEKNYIEIDLPKHFSKNFLSGLEAAAEEVNLNMHSPYYYTVGKTLCDL